MVLCLCLLLILFFILVLYSFVRFTLVYCALMPQLILFKNEFSIKSLFFNNLEIRTTETV